MSGRGRHDTEESAPALPVFAEDKGELVDLLSTEGKQHLDSFTDEDRALFAELVEDAGSELQQEFLRRALAARHTPKELHAFGDSIRGMSDDELYDACTLLESGPGGVRRSVVQRMRAEADPIYGFTLNGHSLTDEDASGFDSLGLPSRPRPNFTAPAALLANPPSGELEGSIARGKRLSLRDLGESDASEPSASRAQKLTRRELGESDASEPSAPRGQRLSKRDLGESDDAEPSYTLNRPRAPQPPSVSSGGDDLFSQAVRQLGIGYREVKVDTGNFPVSRAVELMIAALKRGLPVPAILSNVNGTQRRYVLFLQATASAKGHALQIHEPLSNDTVWVNESDLRNGGELPLQNKSLRRLTQVVLPRIKGIS